MLCNKRGAVLYTSRAPSNTRFTPLNARLAVALGRIKSESGAFTLESAIIVPIVIFVVCLLIYINLILFEQAQLQSASDYAAHRVSSVWSYGGLYRRLNDPFSSIKQSYAAKAAETRHETLKLPGYTSAKGSAAFNNGILGKTLDVKLRGYFVAPNKKVTSIFGFNDRFAVNYSARSLAPDFAENIRCFGYALEIERRLEETSPGFAALADSFEEVVAHIRKYLSEH